LGQVVALALSCVGAGQLINPHLHLIVTDGCFSDGGTFTKGPDPEPKDLMELFRYEVLKMLKAEGKINDAVIENMLSWRHTAALTCTANPPYGPTTTKALRLWRAISSAPVFPKNDNQVPALVESAMSSTAFRRNWA
jgi:hypothetical protein